MSRRGERALGLRVDAREGRFDGDLGGAVLVQRLEREELEEDGSQRVDVGARDRRSRLAPARAPCSRASPSSRRPTVFAPGIAAARDGRPARQPRVRRPDHLGQAPVEDVHLAEVSEHDVAGLEVAVDDAADVGEVHRVADAREGAEELAACELADGFLLAHAQRVDDSLESHPADALHREVERSVGVAPEVVHRDDRRVLELPLHARLAKEADGGVPARPRPGLDTLDGNLAPDAAVDARANDAHPSLAERLAHGVARPEGGLREHVRRELPQLRGLEGRRGERVRGDGEGGLERRRHRGAW